ncbi:MICOS complex subunit Mic60 isoform X2 [Episyrphus balteatus]|uniref:MICOS complex subunit Mic60 isoform X2 n=1 Tax=Episyrphus balteatus TaxID=286459 RepID=UPI002486AFB8|nr:MICOS complex subunit Mic60 isoform X2 [Episyrphus balteatus]
MYRLVLNNGSKCARKGTFQAQCQRHSSNNIPRQAGFGKVAVLLAPVVAIGGIISYANYDKEFRKTVEKNVPGSAVFIKFVLEDKPIETVSKKLDTVSHQISNVTSTVTNLFGNTADKKSDQVKEKSTSQASPLPIKRTEASETKSSVKPGAPIAPVTIQKPVETLPKDVVELEKEVELAASLALQEYNKAINILNSFNNDVRKIVDKTVDDIDPTSWTTLKNKTNARDTSVQAAEQAAIQALKKIETCQIALSKIANASNHDRVLEVRNKTKTLTDHINGVKNELYKLKDVSSLSENYWKKVEASRNYFVDQIESIFPGINLAEKKLKISQDDLDLFLLHAYSHVLTYQKELQRLQTDGELRLKRAIEAYRGNDQSVAVQAQLDFFLEKERRKLAIENQNKILNIRADAERQLRKQLKQQAEAHVDHLNDAISLREAELKRNFSRELEEKLSTEKASYKLQLAAMLGKLRGMDTALKDRAESDRSAHQAQALWASCQALWATVRTGEPGVHWRNKLRPLKAEINAVTKVSEGDELVSVVIQNLPTTAIHRGVFPEDALRERFLNVEKVARKVALVPEGGARLPIYLLSYLQSLFILSSDNPVSNNELENKTIDFSKIDTYDILNKARYFVDRGNLMQALKYLNLLQGAPRKVASDWIKEARLLLETQQAANTLMAHAAASGLLYL